jgi:uncharacterized protein YkwD
MRVGKSRIIRTIITAAILLLSCPQPAAAADLSQTQLYVLTNGARAQSNLTALETSAELESAAERKAEHMLSHDYWAHFAPDGTSPWTFIDSAGYRYEAAGENLAVDFTAGEDIMRAWMESPTHRQNVVDSAFTEIGIAVVGGEFQGRSTYLVVALYAKPRPRAKPAVATAAVSPRSVLGSRDRTAPEAEPGSDRFDAIRTGRGWLTNTLLPPPGPPKRLLAVPKPHS